MLSLIGPAAAIMLVLLWGYAWHANYVEHRKNR